MSESMTTPAASTPPRFTAPTLVATIVALAAIAAAIVWRFSPWTHQYFYGDDLDYLLSVRAGNCATHVSEILTETCQERFRPVASGFVLATIDWFGAQMRYYNLVNFLIQLLNAGLVFACARRLSGGRTFASVMVALAVATSRFALYGTTQAIGPVESLAFAAVLACVYCVLRFDSAPSNRLRWTFGALAATLVAINTHERFVVLAAWLAIALLSSPGVRSMSRRTIVGLFLACAALPAAYIGYKTLVLDTTFMVGTGGTHLKPDFRQVLQYAGDAGLSLFGFNHGPAYLVGWQPQIGLNAATLLGIVFIASWTTLLLLGTVHKWRSFANAGLLARLDPIRWPILLLILAAFILFPALLTIRLEHRWLLAPFALLILVAAWGAGNAPARMNALASLLACTLATSSVAIDSLVMRGYGQVFLISSAHFASLAKRDIIDSDPGARGPIRLVAEQNHCEWTLRHGKFFAVYGEAERPLKCYASLDEATNDGPLLDATLYSYGADDRLVNLTAKVNAMLAGNSTGQSVAFDFLSSFDTGKINDTRHVDTPTGQGVMLLPWDSNVGRRETLIVLSGFSYRFEDIAVPARASLHFGVSMIYPAPQSARLVVTATPAGSTPRTLASLDLVPPAPTQAIDFKPLSIDLAGLAGDKVTFEFSVQSPGGDSTAHWVGLVKPVIVQRVAASIQNP